MRVVVVVVVLVMCGCVPPSQPSYYTQNGQQQGAPPPAGQPPADPYGAPPQAGPPVAAGNPQQGCQQTLQCYTQCSPLTQQCMQGCDQNAPQQSSAGARLVVSCMTDSGCQDTACVQQKCSAELSACLGMPMPVAQQQPAQQQQPAGQGGFDLSYQMPAGWQQVQQIQGAVSLQFEKEDFYNPAHYRIHMFPSSAMTGPIVDTFHLTWAAVVAPSFEVSSPQAPYRRRLANGYMLAYDTASATRKGANGYYTVGLYLLYTRDRVAAVFTIGLDSSAEAALSAFFEALSIRGVPPGQEPLYDAAELVGHWSTSSTSVATYVNASGGYAGDASIATAEDINLEANGTYTTSFVGVRGSGGGVQSKGRGRWKLQDDLLVLDPSGGGKAETRRVWAHGTAPRGNTDSICVTPYGTASPRISQPADGINTGWYGKKTN